MIASLCSNVCGPGCLGSPCAFVSVRTPTLTDTHRVGCLEPAQRKNKHSIRNKKQVSSMFILGCLWIYDSTKSK